MVGSVTTWLAFYRREFKRRKSTGTWLHLFWSEYIPHFCVAWGNFMSRIFFIHAFAHFSPPVWRVFLSSLLSLGRLFLALLKQVSIAARRFERCVATPCITWNYRPASPHSRGGLHQRSIAGKIQKRGIVGPARQQLQVLGPDALVLAIFS